MSEEPNDAQTVAAIAAQLPGWDLSPGMDGKPAIRREAGGWLVSGRWRGNWHGGLTHKSAHTPHDPAQWAAYLHETIALKDAPTDAPPEPAILPAGPPEPVDPAASASGAAGDAADDAGAVVDAEQGDPAEPGAADAGELGDVDAASGAGGTMLDQRLSDAAARLMAEFNNRAGLVDPRIQDLEAEYQRLFAVGAVTKDSDIDRMNEVTRDLEELRERRKLLSDHLIAMQSALLTPGFDLSAFDPGYGWP